MLEHDKNYHEDDNTNEILNVAIMNIVSAMYDELSADQISKIKDLLYINFKDIKMTKKCYDLATVEYPDNKLLEYFAVSKKISNVADSSIKQYVRTAEKLREHAQKNFVDINTGDIKLFLLHGQLELKWSDNTINNNIYNLRSFYSFLMKEEIINKNPMDKIDQRKTNDVLEDPFTIIDIEKLRNICINDSRDIALIEFLLSSGVRVAELCSIKWYELQPNNTLKVIGKGSKQRTVPFSEKTKYYLDIYFKDRMKKENRSAEDLILRPLFVNKRRDIKTHDYEELSTNDVRNILNRIANKANVQDVHPHRFRKTFATICLKKGMSLEQVKELLGHESCDTTLIYARISNDSIENAYKSIF